MKLFIEIRSDKNMSYMNFGLSPYAKVYSPNIASLSCTKRFNFQLMMGVDRSTKHVVLRLC